LASIGRYKIIKKLATGGMAEVFLAKVAGPAGFEKHVVVKQILPQLAETEQYVAMFLEEARLAAQLEHPNVVHVFDFGEVDGKYFLAMEYVNGANLRQVQRWAIRDGGAVLAPSLVARIVSQACEGLGYAHQFVPAGSESVTKLVHRDVSPENIMLARTGSVKVLDFGVAKVTSEDQRSKVGSLKGKIAYMPPEQLRGDVDHRVDIYALGVVLYLTLSGKRPYPQNSDVGLIQAILNEEPTPLATHRPDLPSSLVNIVKKAMAKDRAARYQTCDELRDALEEFISTQGPSPNPAQIAQLVAKYQAANTEVSLQKLGSDSGSSGSSSAKGSGSTPAGEGTDPGSFSDARSLGSGGSEIPRGEAGPSGWRQGRKPRGAPTEDPSAAQMIADAKKELAQARGGLGIPLTGMTPPPKASAPGPAMPRVSSATPRPANPTPGSFVWPTDTAPPGAPQKAPPQRAPAQAPGVVVGTLEEPPRPSAPRPEAPAPRPWVPVQVALEPIRRALRESVRASRSTHLLRKLPPVIGHLADLSAQVPWPMTEALAGMMDAALLADDHATLGRLLDRAAQRPGKDSRFATMVNAELGSPLRLMWLAERMRSGLPADVSGLRDWLVRLSPETGPALLAALEMNEPGPSQELFAEALAHVLPADPQLVLSRLEQPDLRTLAALSFALERSLISERNEVFRRLISQREPAVQAEVLTGRARARGADAMKLLENSLGDRSEEVRRTAISLIGELGGPLGYERLHGLMKDPGFDARPLSERQALWAALLDSGGEAAQAEVEQLLMVKPSLINKKKVNEQKLAAIEGLGRAKGEMTRAQLRHVANDASQGEEVQQAAMQALKAPRRGVGEHITGEWQNVAAEWRKHQTARITLDLALLARASTAVDIGSGLLDAAVERFRESGRLIHQREGKLQLRVGETGISINGGPVKFGQLHDVVTPAVVDVLRLRNFGGVALESVLQGPELRSFFFYAFDPDGRREPLPALKVIDPAGQLLAAVAEGPMPADPSARARELFSVVVRWLSAQRDGLRSDRPVELSAADGWLDEWTRLMDAGEGRFLGLTRWPPGETGVLVHAANTAALGMAFAHDLGLSRSAVREICEASLVLGLAEAVVKAERRPAPGEPTGEAERFYAAGLVLTQRLNRLGTATAVAAVEAGMSHAGQGRGPGIVASVHALAKTFDQLTAGSGGTPAQALEVINGKLRERFSSDLLGLFTQWAFSQNSAR
jgi:serine/threonine-protein kinase